MRNNLVVTVYYVESGNLSYYGNPSKILRTSEGTFKTMVNAGFVYGIDNNGGLAGHKVELSLTPAGRVTNARKLKSVEDGGLNG